MKSKVLIMLLISLLLGAFLRLYQLDANPPALYWDEASLGYNAFAILTTGHDEHGKYLPLTHFVAFGDYKPPGYIYALVPAMAVFGATEFAIRFPSALSGILFILITYLLVVELFQNRKLALVSSVLMAVSPWSLQLSRAAFEAHLAAIFHLIGTWLFLKGSKQKPWLLVFSALFFGLTFYTFNANRVLLPIWLLFLGLSYVRELWKIRGWVIASAIFGIIMLSPYIFYFQSQESRNRLQEVSIFNNLQTVALANERIKRQGNTWWAKLVNNRRLGFAREYLKHYFDHFRGDYLFIHGDRNPRLSIQDVGELYFIELLFVVAGLYFLIKRKNKNSWLILGWWLLPVVPAAVARETPHMLRTASILPSWQIISAAGVLALWHWGRQQKKQSFRLLPWLLVIILGSNIFYYMHQYWVHYPMVFSGEWQYGYKQLVKQVRKYENSFDRIYITESLGRPYIYFLLYNLVNPLDYVATRDASRDWYGFWEVKSFAKYYFVNPGSAVPANSLIVGGEGTFKDKGQQFSAIVSPEGKTVFEIGVY